MWTEGLAMLFAKVPFDGVEWFLMTWFVYLSPYLLFAALVCLPLLVDFFDGKDQD